MRPRWLDHPFTATCSLLRGPPTWRWRGATWHVRPLALTLVWWGTCVLAKPASAHLPVPLALLLAAAPLACLALARRGLRAPASHDRPSVLIVAWRLVLSMLVASMVLHVVLVLLK